MFILGLLMSTISDFFNLYKVLDANLEVEVSTDESTSKMYEKVKNNLIALSSLSKEKLDNIGITFSSDGSIVVAKFIGVEVRKAIKKHLFQYSSHSQDTRRDLLKFTEFVKHYFITRMQGISLQRILVLEKLVQQSIKGLEALESYYEMNGKNELKLELVRPRKKLQKALLILLDGERVKTLTPFSEINSHIKLLNAQEIDESTKVLSIKNKLDIFRRPPEIFVKEVVEQNFKDQELISEKESQLKKINDELDELMKDNREKDEERELKQKKLLKLKKEIQQTEEYIFAKERVVTFNGFLDEHEKNYQSIFKGEAFSFYSKFVDRLKKIFPKAEDRAFLLSNLLLKKPSKKEMIKLLKALLECVDKDLMNEQVKTLQRNVIKKCHFFDGALVLIETRQEIRRLEFEKSLGTESRKWKIGRGTAKFLAAGGLGALSILFPGTSVALGLIPTLSKSAFEDFRDAWNSKTKIEQGEITKEVAILLEEIKHNPLRAQEIISKQFKDKEKTGKKIEEFIEKIAEIVKKNPKNFEVLVGSIGGKI